LETRHGRLPPEILHIIVDLLLADGDQVGHVVGNKWTYRHALPIASCSWYFWHIVAQRKAFWRVDSRCTSLSSVTGQILKKFGPPPASLMVDLAKPDTWAMCGGILKAFPKLEEIGFLLGRGCMLSKIDLTTLSSHLSGFQGSRLLMKNAWFTRKDLILFGLLEKN
jgi:hypothetical protein